MLKKIYKSELEPEIIDTSITLTNFIDGLTIKDFKIAGGKLTNRQIFEYIYTIICSYASFNDFSGDTGDLNTMIYRDILFTSIEINENIIFFESHETICFIDCEIQERREINTDYIINFTKYKNYLLPLIEESYIKESIKETVLDSLVIYPVDVEL